MEFQAVIDAWDNVVRSVDTKRRQDERAAEDLFRRKTAEADRRVATAETRRTAAVASLNPIAMGFAQGDVSAAKVGAAMVKAKIAIARRKLADKAREIGEQKREVTNWINSELEKGRNTSQTMRAKSQQWSEISKKASALQEEVVAQGKPASWMSTKASDNYSEAVLPQIAALQDLSISASHNCDASENVALIQQAIYSGMTTALKGVRATISQFSSAHGTDEYSKAMNSTCAQLRGLNTWKNSYLQEFELPTSLVAGTFRGAWSAAANLNPAWPSRTKHDVAESDNGDLNSQIRNLGNNVNTNVGTFTQAGHFF